MKLKLKSLLALVLLTSIIYAQVPTDIIMEVGNTPVTVEEFKYIYEKNNGKDANYSNTSIREYLDLYTKFKLKVAKAKEMQMDTISSLKEELDGYKRQLANSYLMDREVMDFLVKQAYERQKEDVKIAHIFYPLSKTSTPEDRKLATNRMEEAKSMLDQGQSFEIIASKYSMDNNTKDNGGELIYYTAMMPNGFYELENAMYDTGVGQYSDIIETRIGLHIVKVLDRRPARGSVSVAHILVKKDSPDAVKTIDEAYEKLKMGSDFTEVVTQYSEDQKTKSNGGNLPEVVIGMFEKSFEDAAFSLEADGDYTKPVETKLGYHIIKRIGKPDMVDISTYRKAFEPKIKKDERYEEARRDLIEDIKTSSKFKLDSKVMNDFVTTLNEEFLTFKWNPAMDGKMSTQTLMSFGGNAIYTLNDFAEFCKKNTKIRLRYDKTETKVDEVAQILLTDFINEKAIDYEQSNLELKYADFRSLMREYEEGILLFEVTKDEVWDKANEDSLGLQAFYEKSKQNYMSEERADLTLVFINTEEEELAKKAAAYIQKKGMKKAMKKFNKKSELIATYSEKLDRSNNQFGGIKWENGAVSELEFDAKAKRYFYKKIEKTYLPQVKELREARGYIVADYQDFLEREWVAKLKKEYPVKVNEAVVKKLIK